MAAAVRLFAYKEATMKELDKMLHWAERLTRTAENWPGVLILSPEEAAQYTGQQHVIVDDIPDEEAVTPCPSG